MKSEPSRERLIESLLDSWGREVELIAAMRQMLTALALEERQTDDPPLN
jgi:hypothetical protein